MLMLVEGSTQLGAPAFVLKQSNVNFAGYVSLHVTDVLTNNRCHGCDSPASPFEKFLTIAVIIDNSHALDLGQRRTHGTSLFNRTLAVPRSIDRRSIMYTQ